MLPTYLHWLGGQPLLFRPRVVLVLSLVVPDTLSGNWLASSSTEFECMALTVSVTHSQSSSTDHSRLFSVGVLDPGMMNVAWTSEDRHHQSIQYHKWIFMYAWCRIVFLIQLKSRRGYQ